jgi:hypothetical protein
MGAKRYQTSNHAPKDDATKSINKTKSHQRWNQPPRNLTRWNQFAYRSYQQNHDIPSTMTLAT